MVIKYLKNELIFSLLAILFLGLTRHYILASLCVIYTLSMLYLDYKEFKEANKFNRAVKYFQYERDYILVDTSDDTIAIYSDGAYTLAKFNNNKLESLERIYSYEPADKLKSLLVSPKEESFKAYRHGLLAFDNYEAYFTIHYITDRKLRKKLELISDAMLAGVDGVELLDCCICKDYSTDITNFQSYALFFYLFVFLFLMISVLSRL